MTRRYGNKPRTTASMKASMETRLTLCTDWALSTITADEMLRHGFYRAEAEARLAAERERRGMADA